MLSLGRRNSQYENAQNIHRWFTELEAALPAKIARRVSEDQETGVDPGERGAVWTCLTTHLPFGSWTARWYRACAESSRNDVFQMTLESIAASYRKKFSRLSLEISRLKIAASTRAGSGETWLTSP